LGKHHHEIAEVVKQHSRSKRKKHNYRKPTPGRVAELRGRGLQGLGRDAQAVLGHNRSASRKHPWSV
jgi:hypothetical protein